MNRLQWGNTHIDEATYHNIEPEIIQSNKKNLSVFSINVMIVLSILFVISFFATDLLYATWIYAATILALGMILACTIWIAPKHEGIVIPLSYSFIIVILIFGICISVFDTPDVESTIFIGLLIVVPLLFIVKPLYLNIVMLGSIAMFLILAEKFEYETVFTTDLTNTICFTVLSVILGSYLNGVRLLKLKAEYENRLLHKQEEERHKEKIEEQLIEIRGLLREQEIQLKEITALNDQLNKALDDAQRANAAKTNFLSQISHDIRTPLNGIIGLLELSERHPEDTALLAQNRKKQIVAANHLLALISDVLDLSKMSDPNVTLSNESFNIFELLADVLTITEIRAAEAGITLQHTDCSKEIQYPYVYGSPLHVRQVALNILGNAIKYNNPGGQVRCEVRMLKMSGNTVTYQCSISDDGIGMSQEFLKHIFEPFTQERTDARSVYQGTGLGMSIVKMLLDKMGGTITVESELGKGSVFTFSIPFEITSKENCALKDIEGCDIGGCKVLIVEDNELNMEIVSSILADCGAIPFEAYDGKQALDAFVNHPPHTYDLILMDLMMPVMDGISAVKAIRSLEREDAKQIPVLAMTANAFSEDAKKCRDAGMNDHIAKPLETKKLIAMIAKYWDI